MSKARLREKYVSSIRSELKNKLNLANVMEVPKITHIVLNVGAGRDIVADSKVGKVITDVLARIAGQKAVQTVARKSIASFKIREKMPLGAKVTLRGNKMYEFLDRLINIALPAVRDFQGVKATFDKFGNYNLGIKEWIIFPEIDYDITDKVYGMNVTIATTAKSHEQAFELLKGFGMPFMKVS